MSLLTLAELLRTRTRATDWVTVDDIGGLGTDIVSSGVIALSFASLPSFSDLLIELQYTHRRTGGGGGCRVWVRVLNTSLMSMVDDDSEGEMQHTPQSSAGGSAVTRRVVLRPLVISNRSGTSADSIGVQIRAKGTSSTTEWTVTNIRGRLLYRPI